MIQKYYVKYNRSVEEFINQPLNLRNIFDNCIADNGDELRNLSSNIMNDCFESNETIIDGDNYEININDVEEKINSASRIFEYSMKIKDYIHNETDKSLGDVRGMVMMIENRVPKDKTNTLSGRFETHVQYMIELKKEHYKTVANIRRCQINHLTELKSSRSDAVNITNYFSKLKFYFLWLFNY